MPALARATATMGRLIDQRHSAGAVAGRGKAEAPGVGEHVQHFLVAADVGQPEPVVALIEEVTRLHRPQRVDVVEQAVLANADFSLRLTHQPLRNLRQAIALAERHVVALANAARLKQLTEDLDQHGFALIEPRRGRLDDEVIGVLVDGESRQAIAFRVNQAEAVGAFAGQARRRASLVCGQDAAVEEFAEVRLVVALTAVEAADDLAAHRQQAAADVISAGIVHLRLAAVVLDAGQMRDIVPEQPRMAAVRGEPGWT